MGPAPVRRLGAGAHAPGGPRAGCRAWGCRGPLLVGFRVGARPPAFARAARGSWGERTQRRSGGLPGLGVPRTRSGGLSSRRASPGLRAGRPGVLGRAGPSGARAGCRAWGCRGPVLVGFRVGARPPAFARAARGSWGGPSGARAGCRARERREPRSAGLPSRRVPPCFRRPAPGFLGRAHPAELGAERRALRRAHPAPLRRTAGAPGAGRAGRRAMRRAPRPSAGLPGPRAHGLRPCPGPGPSTPPAPAGRPNLGPKKYPSAVLPGRQDAGALGGDRHRVFGVGGS